MESEGIWSVSWQEFGTSYILSLECGSKTDERCNSANYALSLVEALVYVGGGHHDVKAAPKKEDLDGEPKTKLKYNPAGKLLPGSGTGVSDTTIYAPGSFPVDKKPAYANSQVWNPGGEHGPAGGSQCDQANYQYPWWDNFCETRNWKTPACPSGTGHQGQDIRPSTCEKDKYVAVSTVDGTVSHIGAYSVFVSGSDGATQYRYLHMSGVSVKVGDAVKQGDKLGLISNVFTTATTIHLHVEILQNIAGQGFVHVPPYQTLINAYEKLP